MSLTNLYSIRFPLILHLKFWNVPTRNVSEKLFLKKNTAELKTLQISVVFAMEWGTMGIALNISLRGRASVPGSGVKRHPTWVGPIGS